MIYEVETIGQAREILQVEANSEEEAMSLIDSGEGESVLIECSGMEPTRALLMED